MQGVHGNQQTMQKLAGAQQAQRGRSGGGSSPEARPAGGDQLGRLHAVPVAGLKVDPYSSKLTQQRASTGGGRLQVGVHREMLQKAQRAQRAESAADAAGTAAAAGSRQQGCPVRPAGPYFSSSAAPNSPAFSPAPARNHSPPMAWEGAKGSCHSIGRALSIGDGMIVKVLQGAAGSFAFQGAMPACASARPHHGCLAAPVPGHVARKEGGEHAGQEQD